MQPRILILSASVGCGHVRAAQAIESALHDLHANALVEHVDVLKLANRAFSRVYGQGYFDMVAKAPHLIGHLYEYLDQPPARWQRPFESVRLGLQRVSLAPLIDLLTSRRWDLAINTHFLPAEIIATLRSASRIDFPQITVTTDFDTHRLWHNDHCAHYFTATQEGRVHLAALGVSLNRISAVGIPIDPIFARRKDSLECRRRLGLSLDRPVVLQLASGLGLRRIAELHARILDMAMPLHVLLVAGRNADALRELQQTRCRARHNRLLFGFTDQIDELMAAADVIVSKPGGLTSSEAMARGTPMVIVDPIPGQETRNADHLLENGAAVKVNNPASLGLKLQSLLSDPARLRKMRSACLRLARPHAARSVAAHAMQMLGDTLTPHPPKPLQPAETRSSAEPLLPMSH